MKGKFITFEGIDGSGKTTQSKRFYEYLISSGIDAIWTREIGGTDVAEKIRELVVNHEEISATAELMLILAARAEHIEKVIKPALMAEKYVVCDRYIDSTAAYQGKTKKHIEKIFYINSIFFDDFLPDQTFYLKIQPEIALSRANDRGKNNKYEARGLDYIKFVSDNYDELSKDFSYRIKTIDASGNEDEVFGRLIKFLDKRLSSINI
jgi:dTMP kinase